MLPDSTYESGNTFCLVTDIEKSKRVSQRTRYNKTIVTAVNIG